MQSISWEKVKEEKLTITVGSLAAAAILLWNMHGWAQDWHFANFVTKAEAQEHQRQVEDKVETLQNQVQRNSQTLETHVHEFRLYAALTRVTALEEKLARHEEMERNLGRTPASEAEHAKLEGQLQKALRYQDCVASARANCQIYLEQQ